MKKWRDYWQVRLSLCVSALNMELVVIPFILKGFFGLDGWNLKIASAVWATSEMFYWSWFTGWLKTELRDRKLKEIQEAVEEAQSIGQDAVDELRDAGILNRIDKWIKHHIIDFFNPESYANKKIFLILVGSGYVVGLPILLFLGALPFLWIVGFVFCRFFDWKPGLAAIFIGNAIKNMFFAEGWDFIWHLFG